MNKPPQTPAERPPKFNLNFVLLEWEKYLLATHHFAVDKGNALWRYENGRYVPNAEGYIAAWLYEKFKSSPDRMHWHPSHSTRLTTAAKLTAPLLWDRPQWTTINLSNCQLQWSGTRWDKMSHNAGWLSPLQLNVAYDPTADCPNWRQFIADLLPDEDPEYTFKLIASLICTARDNTHKAYLFLGETGGEGKSTLIHAIQNLLGPDAYVTRSLQSLESNRFATVDLQGRLALIDADMDTRPFKSIVTFKRIVTQDTIQAEYKGGEQFSFAPYCKVLMASNRVPVSQEGGHQWERRWSIIPFKKNLPFAKRRPPSEMNALLTNPTELSGVLNAALPYIADIAQRGIQTEATWADMISQEGYWHDFSEAWARQSFEYRLDSLMLPSEAYRRYTSWCESRDRSPLSKSAFKTLVGRMHPGTLFDVRPSPGSTPGAERPRYWKHIAFCT